MTLQAFQVILTCLICQALCASTDREHVKRLHLVLREKCLWAIFFPSAAWCRLFWEFGPDAQQSRGKLDLPESAPEREART